MNIFVLSTGRCGSTTFTKACDHISNYTSAHESRCGIIGETRLAYPQNHIESDNRLSWFLGRLDKAYGNEAFYVYLRRSDGAKTIKSYSNRYHQGAIMKAYRDSILMGCPEDSDPISLSTDYYHTVNSNIEFFLKDKTNWMHFTLECAKKDFREFWDRIGAEGNLEAALAEFDRTYNASQAPKSFLISGFSKIVRRLFKAK